MGLKTLAILIIIPVSAAHAVATGPRSFIINPVGCNSTALAQLPDTRDLFLGRQLITADGKIAGLTGPNDCSGGNPENQKVGKAFNQFALTLSKFDWTAHQLTLIKAILDTSVDPTTSKSRAILTGGPMRGAVIRSAYDPDVVRYRGTYYVTYECTLEDPKPYGVTGTSACLSVFNPALQLIDLARTEVIVSGENTSATRFTAAAVPGLAVVHDRLYLYWSALTIEQGKFAGISIRGAELHVAADAVSVVSAKGAVAHSLETPATVEVWRPDPADPTGNTTVDLRGVWSRNGSLIASASVGGSGCTAPSDDTPGCFRLKIVRAALPLGENVFGQGAPADPRSLPSNAQEYTRPIRDPMGHYWLIGHYLRPGKDPLSAANPLPDGDFWQHTAGDSVLALYPLPDESLWPQP